jgi:hypothetical protein
VTYSRIHLKKSNNFPIGKTSQWSLPQNLGPIWIDPRKKMRPKNLEGYCLFKAVEIVHSYCSIIVLWAALHPNGSVILVFFFLRCLHIFRWKSIWKLYFLPILTSACSLYLYCVHSLSFFFLRLNRFLLFSFFDFFLLMVSANYPLFPAWGGGDYFLI